MSRITEKAALKTLEGVVAQAAPRGWHINSARITDAEPGVAASVLRFRIENPHGTSRDIGVALGLSLKGRILWLRTEAGGENRSVTVRFHGLGVRARPATKLRQALERTLRAAAAVFERQPSFGGDLADLFGQAEVTPRPNPTDVLLDTLMQAGLQALPKNERRILRRLRQAGGVVVLSAWHPSLLAAAPAALARAVELPLLGFGNGLLKTGGTPSLVHLELQLSAKNLDEQGKPALIHQVLANNHSLVVTGASPGRMPKALRDFPWIEVVLPPVDRRILGQTMAELFGQRVRLRGDERWTAQVLPVDVERAVAATSEVRKAVALIRAAAEFRTGGGRQFDGPKLAEIAGVGEARRRLLDLAEDIRLAQRGDLAWKDLPRGFLLAGAPGTGKTSLARALAAEVDCPFIALSLTELQAADHLGHHLRAIRSAFDRARAITPSVLFIDEADSLGSRGEIRDRHNGYYHSAVVNCFLEEIQGFESRGGVIIIAATNHPERIDPALRRAGRLDRTLWLDLPDADALADIFRFHVGSDAAENLDFAALGRLAQGRTGADVELYARSARRRARARGDRRIGFADLAAELRGTPDAAEVREMPAPLRRRVAIHEAGHALVRILLLGPAAVSWVSIIPHAEGGLGRVASAYEESPAWTGARVKAELAALLAGRAAEAEILGEDQVSGGAGMGPASDLAVATRLAALMHAAFGLGGTLAWTATDESLDELGRRLSEDDSLRHRVEASLVEAERSARRLLHQHRRTLQTLVAALIAKSELDGGTVAAMVAATPKPPHRRRQPPLPAMTTGNPGRPALTIGLPPPT